jgi:hypothetical protein
MLPTPRKRLRISLIEALEARIAPAGMNVAALNGRNGFQFSGLTQGQTVGNSVSGACEVNGENFDDIINGGSGEASYVILGAAAGFPSRLNGGDLDGSNGFVIAADQNSTRIGDRVTGFGDFNGDGFDDLAVTGPGHGTFRLARPQDFPRECR